MCFLPASFVLQAIFLAMTSKIFEGCVFALNSHTTFNVDDSLLVRLIEENGGTFSRNVGRDVTHLICGAYNASWRIQLAEKHSAQLVRGIRTHLHTPSQHARVCRDFHLFNA